MTAARRQARLQALGLVDWQLRPEPAEAETTGAPAAPVAPVAEAVEPVTTTPAVTAATSATAVPATVATDADADADAGAADLSALDWAGLESWLQQQDHRGAQRAVFGTGARDADLLIVGEAPGAREDEQGLPFVGPAGQLLDRMLATIGRSRQRDVYITNICKFRPPGNRDPHADEVAADWPVLERQIELMQPKLVVAVGRVAAQTLLGSTASLGKLRVGMHEYPQRGLPVIVTYHPAYLLRSPAEKAKSWADLRRIAAVLNGTAD